MIVQQPHDLAHRHFGGDVRHLRRHAPAHSALAVAEHDAGDALVVLVELAHEPLRDLHRQVIEQRHAVLCADCAEVVDHFVVAERADEVGLVRRGEGVEKRGRSLRRQQPQNLRPARGAGAPEQACQFPQAQGGELALHLFELFEAYFSTPTQTPLQSLHFENLSRSPGLPAATM